MLAYVLADVLADHVHNDVLLGDGGKDAMADAGSSATPSR